MNQDGLECTSDVEMIDDNMPVTIQQDNVIDLSDDDVPDIDDDDDDVNPHDDNDARIKELEKRLQSELNLRMGHIGYRYGDDEVEDIGGEDEESKHQTSKKKVVSKKKTVKQEQRGSDGKLK